MSYRHLTITLDILKNHEITALTFNDWITEYFIYLGNSLKNDTLI